MRIAAPGKSADTWSCTCTVTGWQAKLVTRMHVSSSIASNSASRSRRQAVESLRHKRDTLLIRFWLLERHGDASWHNLHSEIEEAWLALKAQWDRNAEDTPRAVNRSPN